MKALSFGAAALLLAGAAMPAAAQSWQAQPWTGGYVGGYVNYGFQPNDDDETILFDTNLDGNFNDNVNTAAGANAFSPGFCGGAANGSTPGDGCRDDRDRVGFGLHAGYDYQMGDIVVGGVVEYGWTRLRDSVTAFSTTPAFYTMTRELRNDGALRARVGYAAGDTLIYGTGGLAYGRVRNSFSTDNQANTFVESNTREDAWGYRVGGGLEQRVSDGFSVGLLYHYTSLKDDDYRVRSQGPAPATNPFILVNPAGTDFARSGDRFNYHTVALTGSFRF